MERIANYEFESIFSAWSFKTYFASVHLKNVMNDIYEYVEFTISQQPESCCIC